MNKRILHTYTVCVYIYIYIYIHTHTYSQYLYCIYTYVYIYINIVYIYIHIICVYTLLYLCSTLFLPPSLPLFFPPSLPPYHSINVLSRPNYNVPLILIPQRLSSGKTQRAVGWLPQRRQSCRRKSLGSQGEQIHTHGMR